jgi:tetratricopeptide (TPR) repeat protein
MLRFARMNRRSWWLVATMMLLLNLMALQRRGIADWFAERALAHAADLNSDSSARFLAIANFFASDTPAAELCRARSDRHRGRFLEAERHIQRARFLGAKLAQADLEQGLVAAQSGQMKLAEPQLADLLEASPHEEPEICLAYSQGYMRLRDFASALTLLEGWAAAYPDDARPLAWIGQIQLELQASEQAERAFRGALELQPENASAALGLGILLLDAKRPKEAIPYFEIAIENERHAAAAAAGLVDCYNAVNDRDRAEQVLDATLERFPNDIALLVKKAELLVESGRYEAAEKLLRPAIEQETRRREIHQVYATALRGLGSNEQAATHFSYAAEAAEQTAAANRKITLTAEDPQNTQLRYDIGSTHLRYGNVEDGLLWLNTVLQIDPLHRPTHLALAQHYQRRIGEDPRFISLAQRHRVLAGPDGIDEDDTTQKGAGSGEQAGETNPASD